MEGIILLSVLAMYRKVLHRKVLYFCSIAIMVCQCGFALAGNIRFEKVSFGKQTLTNDLGDSVRKIVQDSFGFIWIGGRSSLLRYDGERLRSFTSELSHIQSPCTESVRDIVVDHDGVVWIGTDLGLCRYSYSDDSFFIVPLSQEVATPSLIKQSLSKQSLTKLSNSGIWLPHRFVGSLIVDDENRLYIGGGSGSETLTVFSSDRNHTIVHRIPFQGFKEGGVQVNDIVRKDKSLVLGTNKGALLFHVDDAHFSQPFNRDIREIESVAIQNSGDIWFGTRGDGVWVWRENTNSYQHFKHKPSDSASLGSDVVWDILVTGDEDVWLATDPGGLSIYDDQSRKFVNYQYDPLNHHSISSNRVLGLYQDNLKNIWVSTAPLNLSVVNHRAKSIRHIKKDARDNIGINDNGILSFFKTSDGRIWIGTESGLNTYDPLTDTTQTVSVSQPDNCQMGHVPVLSIHQDRDGLLWLGTWRSGVYHYDPNNNRFDQRYCMRRNFSRSHPSYVWDIIGFNENEIWMATERNGVAVYDLNNDTFENFLLDSDKNGDDSPSDNFIWDLLYDHASRVWIGTGEGLDRYDTLTGTYERMSIFNSVLKPLHTFQVRTIFQEADDIFWFGTLGAGIFIYNESEGTLHNLTVKGGLPSNKITRITQDENGWIWVASYSGLAKINPATYAIKAYSMNYGLASKVYNRGALLIDEGNIVYAGGISGASRFLAEILDSEAAHMPARVVSWALDNQQSRSRISSVDLASANKGNQIDDTNSLMPDIIEFKAHHLMVSFDLSAFNFNPNSLVEYQYQLIGFDERWVNLGQSSTAVYTSLPAGRYQFISRALINGEETPVSTPVDLIVYPPFWRSGWAMALYIIAGVVIILIAVYIREKHFELHKANIVNHKLKRLDELKDNLLANTTHELRAPLDGIIGVAYDLANETHYAERLQKTKLIISCGKRLNALVNDILDYSKIKSGELSISKAWFDLSHIVDETFSILQSFSEDQGIDLVSHVHEGQTLIYADAGRLQQILINLISNALKYSNGTCIGVWVMSDGEFWTIDVEDDGVGIHPSQLNDIFKPYEQLEPLNLEAKGTGLGLAISRELACLHDGDLSVRSIVGDGTVFTIAIPFKEYNENDNLASHSEGIRNWLHNVVLPKKSDTMHTGLNVKDNREYVILIVDKDPISRIVMQGQLVNSGYTVLCAKDAMEALRIIESSKIHLVVSDVIVSNDEGMSLCQTIRKNHSKKDLPVIFMSTLPVNQCIDQCVVVGGNELIEKPINYKHFLSRVSDYHYFQCAKE